MSSTTFSHEFNYEAFKGKVNFPTGVFIDGQFSAGSNGTTIEYVVMVCTSYLCFTLLIHTL
jgi:aldehyde dehydrogenase (NAD+)